MQSAENPNKTLKREVKEETSLDIKIGDFVGFWWFYRGESKEQIICSTFLCKIKEDSPEIDIHNNPAQENIVDFRWIDKEEMKELPLKESLLKLIEKL